MVSTVQDMPDLAKKFLAGGISGMAAKSAVAPLDRIKILLQGQNQMYKNFGVWSGMAKIVQMEGFLGLYKGNAAQMVRVFPYAATQFGTFEYMNGLISRFFKENSQSYKTVTGGAAGLNAVVLTYPLDLVRARMTFRVDPKVRGGSVKGESMKGGSVRGESMKGGSVKGESVSGTGPGAVKSSRQTVFGTLVSVAKNEGGLAGLYRGLTPAVIFVLPYSATNFYTFETLKYTLITKLPDWCAEENNGENILNIPSKFLAGGIAGACGATVAFPIDVCRRRMQLSYLDEASKKYSKGFISTLILVYKENGLAKGLYRGLSANYWRAAPLMAMNFTSYELCKQVLGLKTGYKISASG